MGKKVSRCDWSNTNPLMVCYHDREWGVPVHDDRKLFEFLLLDSFQAGLSWSTILKKRDNFRSAFAGFDPVKIAKYTNRDTKRLLNDSGIVRNRLKITAAITNAQKFLEVQKEFGSFGKYVWQVVGGKPMINNFKSLSEIPTRTKESDALSADLQKRGFRFVGSTIIYAFMQAAGLVNDHLVSCFRHDQV